MICKFCHTENPEESVFCINCGKRCDEKLICPACEKELPETTDNPKFCIYCGNKLNFISEDEEEKSAHLKNTDGAEPLWKKVLNYIGVSVALFMAVVALGFVFGTGIDATVRIFSSEGNAVTSDGINLYYYFGKAYTEISDLLYSMNEYTPVYATVIYVPAICGTLISAGMLVSVVTFAVLALVKNIRYLMGKSQKKGNVFAVAAYSAFVIGASLLLMLNNNNLKINGMLPGMDSGLDNITVKTVMNFGLNGLTVAGIIIGAIALAIYVGCGIAVRGRELLQNGAVAKCSIAFASCILLAILLGVLSGPTFGYAADRVSEYYGSDIKLSVFTLITVLTTMCQSFTNAELIENLPISLTFTIMSAVLLIAVMVIGACLLVKEVNRVTGASAKYGLALHIVFAAVSLLFMIFSIIAVSQLMVSIDYLNENASSLGKITFGVPIAAFVLSLFVLGTGIAEHLVNKKLCVK